jgi:hypothetical protein
MYDLIYTRNKHEEEKVMQELRIALPAGTRLTLAHDLVHSNRFEVYTPIEEKEYFKVVEQLRLNYKSLVYSLKCTQ